jgi:site-specific DNA recombinase
VAEHREVAIVQDIFHLDTRRRLGTRATANQLDERGLVRRSGRPWSHKTVCDILTNRACLGEVLFRDIVATNAHKAIIDRATFDHAQQILTERGESPTKKAAGSSSYHLTGKRRPTLGELCLGRRPARTGQLAIPELERPAGGIARSGSGVTAAPA